MRLLRRILFISIIFLLFPLLTDLLIPGGRQLSDQRFGGSAQTLARASDQWWNHNLTELQTVYRAAEQKTLAKETAEQRAAAAQPLPQSSGPDKTIASSAGDIAVYDTGFAGVDFSRDSREYQLPNGDLFYQQRLSYYEDARDQQQVVAAVIHVQGNGGTIRRYDPIAQAWNIGELAEGQYAGHMYFIDTDQQSLIITAPLNYYSRTNQTLEAVPDDTGSLEIRREADDWLVILYARTLPGGQSEYFYLRGEDPLIDWSQSGSSAWSSYDFSYNNRWCYVGYYYLAPSQYIPSGENYYHRLPAAYIASQMAFNDSRGAQDLALCMLDVMLELQNKAGWFPTYAGTDWLLQDYQIGPGFYDTRFNSDLMKAVIQLAQSYQIEEFTRAAWRYGTFYLGMAAANHFDITDAAGQTGWLVYDYYSPAAQSPTHCSLNHQAAEIMVLYRLNELTGDPQYEQLAQKMLLGITNLGSRWIKGNGSLHYAYLPDGNCGMDDYLYLTYNDLYQLQQLLVKRYGQENAGLAQLLATKLAWLQRNHVSGYDG